MGPVCVIMELMLKRALFLTPKITFVLIISLLLPHLSAAASSINELKEKEKQVDLRVKILQDSVSEEQFELNVITDKVGSLQANIKRIQKQLQDNESRIVQLNQIIDEREEAKKDVEMGLAATMGELEVAERTSTLA